MEATKSANAARMIVGLLIAILAALALSACLATPAHAASTKKPYAGYKYSGSSTVYGAGYINMSTYDDRKVKKGYADFYVYSGNTNLYDSVKDAYVPAKKAFKKLKGMSYNKKKNTLTLKNVKGAKYTLYLHGMGTGFKIVLKGKNALAGIQCYASDKRNSKGETTGEYPCSVTIAGKGSLVLNKNKYNSNAISIEGYGSKSTLTIAKTARVQMYAYGLADIIRVTGTTAKKINKAISINAKIRSALLKRSVKVPGYNTYKQDDVVVLDKCSTTTKDLYKFDNKLYYVDDNYGETYWLQAVTKIGSSAYYTDDYSAGSKTVSSEELGKATKSSGKLLTSNSWSWATQLNKSAYYGEHSDKAVSYFDTKTRRTYYSKWNVMKKVATIKGTIFVTTVKKNVANKNDLPKGYTGVKDSSQKTSYAHSLKSLTLKAG